jgi:4-diphosphocytidyl-2-C-methyl-D-erythritol kinase
MLSFPNCKINLGLNIIGKRTDGFHDLETVFYPIAIKDALEIITTDDETGITFTSTGKIVNVKDEDNICVKAYQLLKKDYPQIGNIKMHLHKTIPMGAGMGGGSADASAVLLMLNKQFNLQLLPEKLIDYALQLGSDCPFFIINKPCFGSGRGEILEEQKIDLSTYKIMIVNSGIHVHTGDAFGHLDANSFSPAGQLQHAISEDIHQWKNDLKNDFEQPVFEKYPTIKEIKETMYNDGAIYSAMSGTGSTVFGIFEKETAINIKFPAHYFCQLV